MVTINNEQVTNPEVKAALEAVLKSKDFQHDGTKDKNLSEKELGRFLDRYEPHKNLIDGGDEGQHTILDHTGITEKQFVLLANAYRKHFPHGQKKVAPALWTSNESPAKTPVPRANKTVASSPKETRVDGQAASSPKTIDLAAVLKQHGLDKLGFRATHRNTSIALHVPCLELPITPGPATFKSVHPKEQNSGLAEPPNFTKLTHSRTKGGIHRISVETTQNERLEISLDPKAKTVSLKLFYKNVQTAHLKNLTYARYGNGDIANVFGDDGENRHSSASRFRLDKTSNNQLKFSGEIGGRKHTELVSIPKPVREGREFKGMRIVGNNVVEIRYSAPASEMLPDGNPNEKVDCVILAYRNKDNTGWRSLSIKLNQKDGYGEPGKIFDDASLQDMVNAVLAPEAGKTKKPSNESSVTSPPATTAAGPHATLTQAYTEFGLYLFKQIVGKAPSGENVFISPYSVATALSMLYHGADEKTRSQILQALNLNGVKPADVAKGNKALMAHLQSLDPKVAMKIANALWVKKGSKVDPGYRKTVEKFYGGEIGTLGPNAVDKVNEWIAENTDNMIQNMVRNIPPQTPQLLANAIYFKGTWTNKFKLVGPRSFTTSNGKDVKVPTMSQDGKFGHFKTDDFEAIRLPYGDKKVSMVVFLPSSSSSLANLQQKLTGANWNTWMAKLNGSEKGTITMPKFKAEFGVDLGDTLKAMGMPNVAQGSEVKHRAVVEVDENGTKAAAVTIVRSRGSGGPFSMRVNRPFLFAIVDDKTGLPVFMGTVSNPIQGD